MSVAAGGGDSGNDHSAWPVVSPDGTKVAFHSSADDLGPADHDRSLNGFDFVAEQDLYLRDLTTGTTTLVSVNDAGTRGGNQHSVAPVFGPDGSKIGFMSQASDLGPRDTNGSSFDVYVRDRRTATTTLVSSNPDGTDSGDQPSEDPELSPDGTKVLFGSRAGNLVPGGTAPIGGIYLATLHGADLGVGLVAGAIAGTTGPDGDRLVYTLRVANAGPDAADEVAAAVLVPEGVTVDAATGDGATCRSDPGQPRLVTCALGTVDADDEVTVAVEVAVEPGATRPLVAFAAVRSTTVDPAYADNATAAVTGG